MTDLLVGSEQASTAANQALRVLSNLVAGNAIQQTVAVEDVIPTVVVLLKSTLTAPNGQHVHLLIKVGGLLLEKKASFRIFVQVAGGSDHYPYYQTSVNALLRCLLSQELGLNPTS